MPTLFLLLAAGTLLISAICTGIANGSGNHNIVNILFLESAGGEFDAYLAAVRKAVEDVNMDPGVLPDYSLKLLYNENITVSGDTEVNDTEPMHAGPTTNNRYISLSPARPYIHKFSYS